MKQLDIKSAIIGALLVLALGLTAGVKIQQAADRYFNPRGLSAISLTILDQLNVIRSKLPTPLAAISSNQMLTAIDAKFDSIDPFTYETNGPAFLRGAP